MASAATRARSCSPQSRPRAPTSARRSLHCDTPTARSKLWATRTDGLKSRVHLLYTHKPTRQPRSALLAALLTCPARLSPLALSRQINHATPNLDPSVKLVMQLKGEIEALRSKLATTTGGSGGGGQSADAAAIREQVITQRSQGLKASRLTPPYGPQDPKAPRPHTGPKTPRPHGPIRDPSSCLPLVVCTSCTHPVHPSPAHPSLYIPP